jgi:hypothetical protein
MNFSYERRYQLIDVFIAHNKNFESFKEIPLRPNVWGWTGSAVPVYQSHIEYLEKLLPLLNTVELLEHRQHIEEHIKISRNNVEQAKRKHFMED